MLWEFNNTGYAGAPTSSAATCSVSAPRGTKVVACDRLANLSLNDRMPTFPTVGFGSTGKPTSGPGGSSALPGRSGPAVAFGLGFRAGAGAPGRDPASLAPRGN